MSSVKVSISSTVASTLLLFNQLDAAQRFSVEDADAILSAIPQIRVGDMLNLIKCYPVDYTIISPKNIPQTSDMETIRKLPNVVYNGGVHGVSYAQLGLNLRQDPSKSVDSNRKYGEEYGKICSQLGTVKHDKRNHHFYDTSLGIAFQSIESAKTQDMIIRYLLFRIPIVQLLLNEAENKDIRQYVMTSDL